MIAFMINQYWGAERLNTQLIERSDDMPNTEIKCPSCNTKMHKAGFGWSGSRKVQRFRCPKCGKVVQRK